MSSVQLRLSIEVRAYSPQRCKFIGHKTFSDVSGLANTNDNLLAPIAKGVLKKLDNNTPVAYTNLRAHETPEHLVCRLLLEKKKKKKKKQQNTKKTKSV